VTKASTLARRPPLWLAAAALAAGWGAVYSVGRWTLFFVLYPIHEDARIWYLAAEAGLRYGWSTIYDLDKLRSLASSFPAHEQTIDSGTAFISPPLLAWLVAPLTAFSEPVAYGVWTVVSLGALIWAWHIAAPYQGLAKVTLLMLALAMWPILLSFYFGQPTIVMLALVASGWWLCAHDRPVAAGAVLALATALKPHIVVVLPLALLVSGRYRVVVSWAAAGAVLAAAFVVSLGESGLVSWWHAVKYVEGDPANAYYTLGSQLGFGPVTYALLAIQGAAALVIARWRRSDLGMVFAVGLIGSVTIAFYLHQADYSMLVMAGWLVLRTSPPLWHRLWLVVGFVTMQALTLGPPTPQLVWDAAWLVILLASSFYARGAADPASRPTGVGAAHAPT
jgi:Glycosyltransferase family 87